MNLAPYVVHDGLFLHAVDRLKSKMKRKRLLLLIVISLLIIGILTFFGEKGILHLLRLQEELVRIKEKNAKLAVENQKLKEEVKRLQTDKRYIEEIARRELGMVKEGEIIYQFDSPSSRKGGTN
jgi:cell division protein FtsB/cell division protein DivIC